MKILVEAPINSLSLGNVSYNIIRELFEKGHDVGIWPTGNIDLKAYDVSDELKSKIQNSINDRYSYLGEEIPCLKVWHLNGSENRKMKNNTCIRFMSVITPRK